MIKNGKFIYSWENLWWKVIQVLIIIDFVTVEVTVEW